MKYIGKIPAMELMRSEEMEFVQLIIPAESAHRAVSYLGRLGLLQFLNLNADKRPSELTFVNQVKRYTEILRKLQFFKDQIEKAGLIVPAPPRESDVDLEELESQLAEQHHTLTEIMNNSQRLRQSYNELLEFKIVLQKAGAFLVSSESDAVVEDRELDEYVHPNNEFTEGTSLLDQEMEPGLVNESCLRFISGIVSKSRIHGFEKMLFRATRGNMLFNRAVIDDQILDPVSDEMVEKMVFVVFYSGEQARRKIVRISEAFGANCYSVSEDSLKRRLQTQEVLSRLSELETTLEAGICHRYKALTTIGTQLTNWSNMVIREKAVYDTMNMLSFDFTSKCLVGEGWCPVSAKAQIQEVLERATIHCSSQVGIIFQALDAVELPPTYFRTNRFTKAFQEIVDAYGVARYQEANPTVYTLITFPFLFAVMFGDWGHGLCLALGALYLIARERKLASLKLGSLMEILYKGRYMLLLMSLFSIYCGLIYNEFFSVSYHIFGKSAYKCRDPTCSDAHSVGLIKYRDSYPFGVDPSWRGSRSELPFLNSLKMKLSILLGVAQMNLGIILSYLNARFSRNSLDISCQFVPQTIFLNSLFGYLSLLIITKWCTGSQADLYHVMIYMFLSPFEDLGDNQLFRGQRALQNILLISAVIAVPWMLFPKPFILKKRSTERYQGQRYGILGDARTQHDMEPGSVKHDLEDFNFSEVFVYQMIHSIEFVLGAVSNTASYLRLWALSLAHSELSTVFYEKILRLAWGYKNIIIRLVGVVVFVFVTVFVLLLMETLSAILHALRLHWVEFQNKFYHGDGYKFRPFSFDIIADDES